MFIGHGRDKRNRRRDGLVYKLDEFVEGQEYARNDGFGDSRGVSTPEGERLALFPHLHQSRFGLGR